MTQVVLNEGGDSFFEQWVRECMPLKDKPKSPYKMLQNVDSAKVEALLNQISSGEVNLKTTSIKWNVACHSAMGVIKELLFAWEAGALNPTDVKKHLNCLRLSSCCLPVCAAAWLCSYMSITSHDVLLKPMNMVQQLHSSVTGEEMQDKWKER